MNALNPTELLPVHVEGMSVLFSSLVDDCRIDSFGNETTKCRAAHVKIDAYDSTRLENALNNFDLKRYVQRINLDFKNLSDVAYRIERQLDNYIAPRPWWMITSSGKHGRIGSNSVMSRIILLRQTHWENELRFIAAIQFPPPEECKRTPLLIGHMVDSGWGSQAMLYGSYTGNNIYKVFNVWDSAYNEANASTYYVNARECPDVVNKRLCAFIPMTNCTMPTAVTQRKYKPQQGNTNRVRMWESDFMYYTSASASGTRVTIEEWKQGKEALSLYHVALQNRSGVSKNGDWPPASLNTIALGGDYQPVAVNAANTNRLGNPSVKQFLFVQAFLFRANAQFRQLVFEQLHNHRLEHKWPLGNSFDCVTIHIRRGDRVINNLGDHEQEEEVSRGEYCHGWRYHKKSETCTRLRPSDHTITETIGKEECRQRLIDLGCWSYAAFGSLSLESYLRAAEAVAPRTQAAVVLTDDPEWIQQQQQIIRNGNGMYSQWAIHAVPARYSRYDKQHQTESGVDYLLSIHLARQCHSFVGHFWSGFSQMIYQAMCYQHGNTVGHCPAVFDVGRVYGPAGEDKESCFVCEENFNKTHS